MSDPSVRVERDGAVVTVTLDSPRTRNACTFDMWMAIRDAFRDVATTDARAVVLTGEGDHFCSGADLSASFGSGGFEGTHLSAMRALAESVLAVHECPVPVVVKVDGVSVGAGFGLALAGDLLYCSDRARFSAVFSKMGLSLDYGTSWFLVQRIGVHRAKELAFSGEMMDAARALDLGFVNAVVPADELDDHVATVVDGLASGPPIALSMTKRMLDVAGASSLAHALETEALAQNVNLGTDDLKEALRAFREKRRPTFHGR